jgi:hypothetical protein
MSKVQVDKVVNLSDDGAPQLTYGAELPVGYGLTGAGGLNISGVVTAASAVFSGNVTIGGTLTYEDVTNIDVVGVSTFAGRMNVNSTIEANEGINVSAGVGTFAGNVSIADKIIHTGDTNTALRFPSADAISFETGGSEIGRFTNNSLKVGTTVDNDFAVVHLHDSGTAARIHLTSGNTGTATTQGAVIMIDSGKNMEVLNRENTNLEFFTNNSQVGSFDSSGRFLIGTTTEGEASADNLTIADSGNCGITIRSGSSNAGGIYFSDGTSGDAEYRGLIGYNQTSDYLQIFTGAAERLRIDSSGRLIIGATSVSPANSYSDNLVVSEAAGDCGISIHGNNSNSNYASLYFGDAGSAQRSWIETQLGSGGNLTIGNGGVTRFYNNGAERLRIDSSGRLLSGTDTSRGVGDVTAQIQLEGNGYPASSLSLISNAGASSGNTPHLTLGKSRGSSTGSNTIVADNDSLGQIQFAGADGTDCNCVAATIIGRVNGTPGGNDMPGRLVFGTTADGAASPSETMRLMRSGSHGNMYLNTTSQIESSVFSVSSNGTANIGSKVTADNTQTHIIFANGNGNVGNITTNGSATSYNTSSDYRLKENASAITDGITRLKTLKPYRFNWKSVGVGTTVDGFLAHEVTAVPEAITGTKDLVTTSSDVSAGIATAVGIPIYQGIDQSKLVPLLTAALQEAVEETESLKTLIKNSSSFAALKSSL